MGVQKVRKKVRKKVQKKVRKIIIKNYKLLEGWGREGGELSFQCLRPSTELRQKYFSSDKIFKRSLLMLIKKPFPNILKHFLLRVKKSLLLVYVVSPPGNNFLLHTRGFATHDL
jgi:hypothetical protein